MSRSIGEEADDGAVLARVETVNRRPEPIFPVPAACRRKRVVDAERPILFLKHGQNENLICRPAIETFHKGIVDPQLAKLGVEERLVRAIVRIICGQLLADGHFASGSLA